MKRTNRLMPVAPLVALFLVPFCAGLKAETLEEKAAATVIPKLEIKGAKIKQAL